MATFKDLNERLTVVTHKKAVYEYILDHLDDALENSHLHSLDSDSIRMVMSEVEQTLEPLNQEMEEIGETKVSRYERPTKSKLGNRDKKGKKSLRKPTDS